MYKENKNHVNGKIDILLIPETKIDNTFPTSTFEMQNYKPVRFDRTAYVEGPLLFARRDITAEKLLLLCFGNIFSSLCIFLT